LNKFSNNQPEPSNWEEQLELLQGYTLELQSLAREMMTLLRTHNESNWEQVYSNFAQAIGNSKSNHQRLKAIDYIHSIYGGMGSWNDFYLLALGEAEKQRMSLGIAIYNLAKKMKTQILTGPKEPKRSLWEKLKGKLS
tara:strand:- start:30 stop:443 length:414 start_codon:yes stop_codon:yes gene_type:complete